MTRAEYLVLEREHGRTQRCTLIAGLLCGYWLHALLGWLAA